MSRLGELSPQDGTYTCSVSQDGTNSHLKMRHQDVLQSSTLAYCKTILTHLLSQCILNVSQLICYFKQFYLNLIKQVGRPKINLR